MYTGNYKIASCCVRITSLYENVHRMCHDYRTCEIPEMEIVVAPEDIEKERQYAAHSAAHENIAPDDYPDAYLETLAVYRQFAEKALAKHILLFHGSAIAVDGVAYLFTARSGTGKSTHTRLWREYFGDRAVMINDDKPMLSVGADRTLVFGTPWDGKHHLSKNDVAPLKAICVLERSDTNHIARMQREEALLFLLQQCYRSSVPEHLTMTLALLDRMMGYMHFYRLGCNMDPEAVQVSFWGMQE